MTYSDDTLGEKSIEVQRSNYNSYSPKSGENVRDIYGSNAGDLEAIALIVTQLLGTELYGHSSSYFGEYYQSHSENSSVIVTENLFSDFDGEEEWAEDAHKEFETIVYLDYPASIEDRVSSLENASGFVKLGSERWVRK